MLSSTLRRLPVVCLAVWPLTAAGTAIGADQIDFNQQIRPILSENCFHCHGPDDNARQADLRLDTQAGAHDYAIVPGDAEDSEVISRITSEDPDAVMPPTDSGRSLTAQQIDRLRQWVAQGAQYESHWSFIPPRKRELPAADGDHNSQQAIDLFIRSRLAAYGTEHKTNYRPATRADRETLIR